MPIINFINFVKKSLYIFCQMPTKIPSTEMKWFNILQSE